MASSEETTTTSTTTTTTSTTTTAPPTTTTTAAPATTTTAPATTTTAATTTTTTAAPVTTTTVAGETTTTTTAPSTTTTAPGTTTTASGAPAFTSVEVAIDPDDGSEQSAHSIPVPDGVKLTLNWETTGAIGVHIDPLGDFGASGSEELPTEDRVYTLVAVGDGGVTSVPWPLEIDVHESTECVSAHVDLGAGAAGVSSFQATKHGEPITEASIGDTIALELVAAGTVTAAKIAGQDVELTETGDGQWKGTLEVTLTEDMDGSFEAQVLQDEEVAASQSLMVDISPAAGPATTTTEAPLAWSPFDFGISLMQ